jgi:DNA-binding FadR family transcriptional regulator
LDHPVTRLHETMTRRMLQRIADGELAPGTWLGREKKLAEELQVSHGVARETIMALKERGVVDVRHGRGQWVLPEEEWHLLDPQVLAAIVTARRLDIIREIVECQAMLEPAAAALAAERGTDAAIKELAARHEAVVQAARGRREPVALEDPLVRAEVEFQKALAAMTGNRPLQRMLAPIDTALALSRHELAAGEKEEQALVRALRRTLRAIEAHDADAARKSAEARVAAARRWVKRAG